MFALLDFVAKPYEIVAYKIGIFWHLQIGTSVKWIGVGLFFVSDVLVTVIYVRTGWENNFYNFVFLGGVILSTIGSSFSIFIWQGEGEENQCENGTIHYVNKTFTLIIYGLVASGWISAIVILSQRYRVYLIYGTFLLVSAPISGQVVLNIGWGIFFLLAGLALFFLTGEVHGGKKGKLWENLKNTFRSPTFAPQSV